MENLTHLNGTLPDGWASIMCIWENIFSIIIGKVFATIIGLTLNFLVFDIFRKHVSVPIFSPALYCICLQAIVSFLYYLPILVLGIHVGIQTFFSIVVKLEYKTYMSYVKMVTLKAIYALESIISQGRMLPLLFWAIQFLLAVMAPKWFHSQRLGKTIRFTVLLFVLFLLIYIPNFIYLFTSLFASDFLSDKLFICPLVIYLIMIAINMIAVSYRLVTKRRLKSIILEDRALEPNENNCMNDQTSGEKAIENGNAFSIVYKSSTDEVTLSSTIPSDKTSNLQMGALFSCNLVISTIIGLSMLKSLTGFGFVEKDASSAEICESVVRYRLQNLWFICSECASFIHPIVYLIISAQFRQEVRNRFSRCCCCICNTLKKT